MLDFIGSVLRGDFHPEDAATLDFVRRFQQFSAPAMAKGLEDTSFYVFNRLAALNEVGGDPRIFGTTATGFHRAMATRAKHWPHSLLATSTHDNKRSEDVRARIDALSESPAGWRLALRRWRQFNRRHRSIVDERPAPSRNDEYLFYQTLIGAWPLTTMDQPALDALRARLAAYMQKAAREAKVDTSWVNVNEAYEAALARFVDGALATLDDPFITDFAELASRIAMAGCVNSLAQVAIKFLAPGVPDTYQGCEIWDLSLVDPDNRRPVDYAQRAALLGGLADANPADLLAEWRDGRVKLWLVATLLALRKQREAWFAQAAYVPLAVRGPRARHVLAFMRKGDDSELACIVPRLWQSLARGAWPLGEDTWSDTTVVLPRGARGFRNVLTNAMVKSNAAGEVAVADALASFPVAVLDSTPG